MLRNAGSVVALTGAGISTSAGIPDFRGPNGLYMTRKYDPELVFNLEHFRRDPLLFYQFTSDFMEIVQAVRPTYTHYLLALLEDQGILDGVITQNIDALHHHAGSGKVLELHGSYWSASCMRCDDFSPSGISYEWWQEAIRTDHRTPIVSCPRCDGVVKPNVVFFGEAVRDFDEAAEMVAGCDLLLVLGSSLAVYPAALLPQMAAGKVLVINQGEVRLAPTPSRYYSDAELDPFFRSVAAEMGISTEH
jgi:NAD-dependent deacetylase